MFCFKISVLILKCDLTNKITCFLFPNATPTFQKMNTTLSAPDLTFKGPRIANIFSEYNQQDATFHNVFISVRRSTCFRRVFRPSSGAQKCIYSVRHLSDRYCYLLLAFHNLFISVRRSTCFRRVFRLSSGAQKCTYSDRYLSDRYCYLLLVCG